MKDRVATRSGVRVATRSPATSTSAGNRYSNRYDVGHSDSTPPQFPDTRPASRLENSDSRGAIRLSADILARRRHALFVCSRTTGRNRAVPRRGARGHHYHGQDRHRRSSLASLQTLARDAPGPRAAVYDGGRDVHRPRLVALSVGSGRLCRLPGPRGSRACTTIRGIAAGIQAEDARREGRWEADLKRRERLQSMGRRVLVFVAADVHSEAGRTVERVRAAMLAAGMSAGTATTAEWRRHFDG